MKDDAVSDVVGTILLVGITVLMMVGLSLVVLGFEGPEDKVEADLSIQVKHGSGGWGDGDEVVLIRHLGGEPLSGTIQVLIRIDGVLTTLDPVGQGFLDGVLHVGERWETTLTINEGSRVEVGVLDVSGNHLITTTSHIAGNAGAAGGPNLPPTASFTFSCTNLQCDFDGLGSNDADGTIASWAWDFGGDGTAAVAQPSHTFSGAGTYSVVLTVTDDGGATDMDTQDVTVIAGPPADPGYAYADVACNGVYDAGTDTALNSGQVTDGNHDAGTSCLVIPASVGAISASSISFAGKGLTITVALTATGGGNDLVLTTTTSPMTLSGVTLIGSDDVFLDGAGTLTMVGTTVTAQGDDVLIGGTTPFSAIDATNAVLTGQNDMILTSTGSITLVNAAILTTTNGNGHDIFITAGGDILAMGLEAACEDDHNYVAGGDIDLRSTDLFSSDDKLRATLTGPGSTMVLVQDGVFDDADDAIDITPNGRSTGTPAAGYGVE